MRKISALCICLLFLPLCGASAQLAERVRDIFNQEVAYMEVFAVGVSKAAAIRRLAGRIGADRVTVYGDNLNDLPMFAVADEAVAVANAMPGVGEKADRRIGANYEDAVALDIAMCARADGFRG